MQENQSEDVPLLESSRTRVLHFVTGGFSGDTQVAVDLCLAGVHSEQIEPLLVLRRKRNTDNARVQALRDPGLGSRVAHAARRRALEEHGMALMARRYEELLVGLVRGSGQSPTMDRTGSQDATAGTSL